MGKIGRPKGFKASAETKVKISAAGKRAWATHACLVARKIPDELRELNSLLLSKNFSAKERRKMLADEQKRLDQQKIATVIARSEFDLISAKVAADLANIDRQLEASQQ